MNKGIVIFNLTLKNSSNYSNKISDSKLENCGPNSGSCIMEPSGRVFNLGDADDSLEWSSTGELTLRYKAKSGNQTLIRFRCGQTRDGAVAAFIERR